MKPETMNILLWVIPVMMGVIGTLCMILIGLVIKRLTKISELLQGVLIDNAATKSDIVSLKDVNRELKEDIRTINERIHQIEMDRSIIKPNS